MQKTLAKIFFLFYNIDKGEIIMYIGKKKYKHWTIEEKNKIVKIYLSGKKTRKQVLEEYNIPCYAVLLRWIDQNEKFGTCVDNRGRCTKAQNPRKGRPRKVKPESENKETSTTDSSKKTTTPKKKKETA